LGTQLCRLTRFGHRGIKQKERYLELFGISIENKIFVYSDIDNRWKNKEMSNKQLIDDTDKTEIQKRCYPDSIKFSKKVFHRSIQELFLKKRSL
jgi:hypothetical protein